MHQMPRLARQVIADHAARIHQESALGASREKKHHLLRGGMVATSSSGEQGVDDVQGSAGSSLACARCEGWQDKSLQIAEQRFIKRMQWPLAGRRNCRLRDGQTMDVIFGRARTG